MFGANKVKYYEDLIYIQQCVKATEIQKDWQPTIGDIIYTLIAYEEVQGDDWPCVDIKVGEINIIHNAWRMDDDGKNPKEKTIWLPRQEDLQDMVDYNGGQEFHIKFHLDYKYMAWDSTEYWQCYATSMTQLWLAFVYKQKYNKVWDGEDWVIYQ